MAGRRLAWLILATAAGSLAVGSGVRSMFGVMMPLIEADLGYDRAVLSAVASISFFIYAFTQPLSGWAVARFGPKRVLLVGAVLMLSSGVGMIWASSLLAIHLFLGIIPMLGFSAGGLLPGTALAAHWFPDRQGLATGFVVGALPGGQALFGALASVALLAVPWREAYVLLTLAFAALLLVLVLLVVRDAPASAEDSPDPVTPTPQRHPVRTVPFWLLIVGFVACGVTDQIMLVHLVPFLADEGYSVTEGSGIFALLSLAGLAGSILVGPVVDAFESRYVLAAVYLLRVLSYAFLFLSTTSESVGLILVFAVAFGLTYMGNMPPTTVFLKSTYGPESVAPVTGWLSMTHHLGGAGGVLVAGVLYERFGGYTSTFVGSVAVLVVAVAASLVLPRTRRASK